MQKIPYASEVGSLMYAQFCTRPDIAFIVDVLGRYLNNPGMDHWKAAKRVMRYLKKTKDYMLTYKRSDHLEIVGYSDSDFAGCPDSRRSTPGCVYTLNGGAISWRSAKQTLVTSSTMEAEFVACFEASHHGIWSSSKSKHIDTKFLRVKKMLQSGQICIEHLGTKSMLADPLTKGVTPMVFYRHTARMDVLQFKEASL
ncbi:secreted RxLR effector protein 161-like [Impatiens glandulifera]|uniref:secreted RxLR effector protein 161-like n=1 Tax=Impatiens glandulifera TaxID=253017 RepID=UPI001FB108FC|nr:secreted RxLR effector protein 161-like [Impatiens glandulifera]